MIVPASHILFDALYPPADGIAPVRSAATAVYDVDPVLLDLRRQLFDRGDRAGRTAWVRELMELTELGYGTQADRYLEGVLGLPPYAYHDAPDTGRPEAPYEGLSPVITGRPEIHSPEHSRLVYLTPVVNALDLTAADIAYDIGSGLGKSCLFFGAFTPVARVLGIEIEPVYARYAVARARDLDLSHVRFVNADALDIDLSLGTVFYFYNPLSSTEETDAVGILAGRLTELGGRKRVQIAVRGESMRELLRASGVFTWHTVLEYPGVWTVFKSSGDAGV